MFSTIGSPTTVGDVWECFGLSRNPFDVKAVEKGGSIPVATFVGRDIDRSRLRKTIETRGHSLSLIVGDKGVGKTSLGNVVRADLFERYFTPLTEIDCQHDWKSKDFIFQVISILYETKMLRGSYQSLPKSYTQLSDDIYEELKPLFESTSSSFSLTAAGFGGGAGSGKGISRDAVSSLKIKFRNIVGMAVKKGYRGIIIQFNNMDNMEFRKGDFPQVLADLRDFLLCDNCHFMFLGDKMMETGFKSNNKVNECISIDVQLDSLNYPTIRDILKKRYELFKIPNRVPTPPVTDDALQLLCGLFEGNIRQVFYSLDRAVVESERILGRREQLNSDLIKKVLFALAAEKMKEDLQPRAFCVLNFILGKKKHVTNTEIAKKLKIKNQNVSKYIGQLKESNLIIMVEKVGPKIFYKPVHETRWLTLVPDSGTQKSIQEWMGR